MISRRPLVRWDSKFAEVEKSQWWYVLKKGPWAIEGVQDKKKRWMIRKGKKNFSVRSLQSDEIISECPRVAQLATSRFKGKAIIESPEILRNRVRAGNEIDGVLEYIGCFHGNTLVSFSENYIQNNSVWMANIRHDPAFLNQYSSYGLLDGILDYYLNQMKMDYVLDGCRSIHHRTNIQDHLIKVFGFTKEYSILNIVYSPCFKLMINLAYPFRSTLWHLHEKMTNSFLDNVCAVLLQEKIRRACNIQS